MEILFEILIEIYMECMFLIVPEERRGRRHYVWTKVLAIVLTLGIMALGVWGGVMIFEEKNGLGWIPFSIAALLSILQITLGIVLHIRRYKKE